MTYCCIVNTHTQTHSESQNRFLVFAHPALSDRRRLKLPLSELTALTGEYLQRDGKW